MHVLNPPDAVHELLTRPQAAAVLGMSPETLRRWYSEGRGPTVFKVGNKRSSRVRYPRALLLQWAANPSLFTEPARPEGLPRFEPPRRGVKRTAGAP